MSKFENYLKRFDIAANVTDEELEKTQALLHLVAGAFVLNNFV